MFMLLFFMSDHFGAEDLELKPWAVNQIDQNLSVFKKAPFKESDIDDAYKTLTSIPSNSLLRFQIIDGDLYCNHSSLDKNNTEVIAAYNIYYRFFRNMIKNYGFNQNVEFIVLVSERLETPSEYNAKVPIIVPVKNTNDNFRNYTVMAPDHCSISEWPRLYSDILRANEKYSWNRKIEKAFWRGSSTDGVYTRENWQDFPRVKMVQLSSENPNLIDAKFTNLRQNDDMVEIIAEKYPLAISVSQSDHVKYKIQISVDGSVSSFSGYLWRLLSNSVVLKQKSNMAQWFHPILQEGTHYISIENDMSDLLDKVKWVLANDEESKNSATVGSDIIRNEITPEHLYLYWDRLLREYSKLQDFTLKTPSLERAKYID
jgi:hypothetical protein